MNYDQRYEGKPFLRLIECYVLRAIGKLSSEDTVLLERMTPELQKAYNITGNWWEIIEILMEFPSTFQMDIQQMWKKNQLIADNAKAQLSPQHFAEMFVDQNIPT